LKNNPEALLFWTLTLAFDEPANDVAEALVAVAVNG
jgi:hypothetical protein